jgi:hypothetical protein
MIELGWYFPMNQAAGGVLRFATLFCLCCIFIVYRPSHSMKHTFKHVALKSKVPAINVITLTMSITINVMVSTWKRQGFPQIMKTEKVNCVVKHLFLLRLYKIYR